MKKLFLTIILLLFAIPVFATDYYVTQSGAGNKDGTAIGDAWDVSQFNALSADYSGDTFYFSGTITSEVDVGVYGTSGNHVILDGYEGGSCDPVADGDCSTNDAVIDRGGGTYCMTISGPDYVTVQDFEMTDAVGAGIIMSGTSTNIVIKKNHIHHLYDTGDDSDTKGINADSSCSYITIGGASGDGNNIHHIGKGTGSGDIDFVGTDDVIISYNKIWSDGTDYGIDGIVFENSANRWLIEYNVIFGHDENNGGHRGEDGIDMKNDSVDTIVRYNHIYGNAASGINTQHGTDRIYVYGNYVHGNGFRERGSGAGIQIYQFVDSGPTTYIYIFSNVVYDNTNRGIGLSSAGGSIDYVYVFNNTIAENGLGSDSDWVNVMMKKGANHVLKNNIIYKSRPAQADERQGYFTITAVDMDYNWYWWPGQTSKVYYSSADRTVDVLQSTYSQEAGIANNEGDPGLTDIDNNDYTIASTASAVYGAGEDLRSDSIAAIVIQGVTYTVRGDEGLGDDTVFAAATIPVIDAQNRDEVGRWDIGASIYGTAPTITDTTNAAPSCPYGADPINVTFSFTTGAVNSYGRISTTNQTWNDMTSSKAMDTGEGTTTHSHVVSLACGQTISYYVAASTEIGDNGAESATTGIEVIIPIEEDIDPPLGVTNLGSGSLGITNLGSGSLTVTIH